MAINGISNSLDTLFRLSDAQSRSISPENPDGRPGGGARATLEQGSAARAARDLGRGWKVNPYTEIAAGSTLTLAAIDGPGALQHIWLTPTGQWRSCILRIYWDGQPQPSVEAPVGDFFCSGWQQYNQISALPVCVNPGSAFNCYWTMPFKKHCRITLENQAARPVTYYYQIDYVLTEVPEDAAYFHAQFRRVNPLPYKSVYTILDGVTGPGHYVGTYLAWGSNNSGWWGEGEMKFYLDEDETCPTICGTGTEDYFCGSYNFEDPHTHDHYAAFSTPYSGFYTLKTDQLYLSQRRFGLYRFHITDPVRFKRKLAVTIQALGWRQDGRYLPLQDDLASVAFWYQTLPTAAFPPLPGPDQLEII
ncbi:MAG: DUF2961 domain-containing protein [Oscillospiraceae bacterium]|nr:DUF2961 domain-containing protein [Oscillospiraceae bacterium]